MALQTSQGKDNSYHALCDNLDVEK